MTEPPKVIWDGNIAPFPGPFRDGGPPLANEGGGGQDSGMEIPERLAKIEGTLTALPMIVTVLGLLSTITLGVAVYSFTSTTNQISQLSNRLDRTDARIDSLAAKMDEGFRLLRTEMVGLRTEMAAEARANRAEMSAQTSAIANSITATRQAAPQVLLVPAPVIQAPPADK